MNRARAAVLLQLTVSVVLLVVLVRQIPLDDVAAAFRRVRMPTLVAGVALSLAGYYGRARRWSLLLDGCGVPLHLWECYRLTLVGTFYGLVTPGRTGEFARVLHMSGPRAATLSSVVWDRVSDVLILELLCVPAFVFVPAWRGPLLWIYLGLVAFTVAGVALLGSARMSRLAGRAAPFLAGPASRWSESSRSLLRRGARLRGLAWGAFFYVFNCAVAWLLLRDLAPDVSPLLLLGLPVIPLLGNLPIAFGGLGLREQVSAAVFGQFGASSATGAAFSLSWFAVVTLLPGLLGLLASTTRWAHAAGGREELR